MTCKYWSAARVGMEAEMEGCADGEEEKVPCQSFTTISSVAVQAGQSQLVISVLKSGSVIHVNLVEVSPSLCEIGSDQEENQTLVREHQQLLIKLKKHESGVTALLSQADQTAEEEEDFAVGNEEGACGHVGRVYEAMADSLREGWSLLVLLLEKRQLLLQVAAVFYEKAKQFTVSLEQAEELKDDQETYRFTRRGLLKRSLQVLTGQSELLDMLRELQNTDSLQRNREVLHFKDFSAQNFSDGRISEVRVEKMVEELQDRRWQLEKNIQEKMEQHFTDLKIPDLNIEEQNIADFDVTEQKITSFNLKKQNLTDLNTSEQQKIEQNITENEEQYLIGNNFKDKHNTEQHTEKGHRNSLYQNHQQQGEQTEHQQFQQNQQPVQKNHGELYQNRPQVQHNQSQQFQNVQQQVHQNHTKQVRRNQEFSDRDHWIIFDTLLQKVLQDLVSVEEVLVVSSKVDLGSDHHIVSRLLLNFQRAQPHFTCLDLQVDKVVRMWASLSMDRFPLKEKKADLQRTQNLHQRIRGQIQRCHRVLSLADSFHQTTNQVKGLIRTEVEAGSSLLEQQVQKLYKRSICLGHSLLTLVEGSPGFSVSRLNKFLVDLEQDVSAWIRKTRNWQDNRHKNLLLLELRKGFQEVRKHFHIEKVSFLKRNDQSIHTSALSTHRLQVELYRDTLQALQGRLSALTSLLGSELLEGDVNTATEDGFNQLQRQMSESERSIDDHLVHLHTTHTLLLCLEEYGVWCADIQDLVLKVEGSITQCCSVQSLSALSSQFNACVCPTLVRQEKSIQHMTEMAVKLHGAAEGEHLMACTLAKHSDIMESISELQQKMDSEKRRLKVKGQEEWIEVEKWGECLQRDEEIVEKEKKKQVEHKDNHYVENTSDWVHPKESGYTPELIREHHGKEMPIDWPEAANRKPLLEQQSEEDEERQAWESSSFSQEGGHPPFFSSFQTFSLSCSPLVPQRRALAILSQSQASFDLNTSPSSQDGIWQGMLACSKNLNTETQDHQEQEVMSEESLSNDDCVSPDDISLPPLPETPESNIVFSDGEDTNCCSSCSAHCNQISSKQKQNCSHSAQYNQYSSWSSHGDNNQHSAHNGHQYNSQYHMETKVGDGLVLEMKRSTGSRASTLEMKGTMAANQPKDAGSSPDCSQHSPSSQSRILQYKKQPEQLSGLFQIVCDPHKQRRSSHLSQDYAVHSTTLQSTALDSNEGVSHDTQCSIDPIACPDTQESHESPVTLFGSSDSAVADEQLIHRNTLPQLFPDEPSSCADDLSFFLPQLPGIKQLPATDDEKELYQHMDGQEAFSYFPLIGEIHKTRVCHQTRGSMDTYGSHETQDSYIIMKTLAYPYSQCNDSTKNSNDAPRQLPPRASEPPNFPIADQKFNVCHPLSVLEAISLIPVISESNDTQVCHNTPVCHNTQYKVGTQEIFDSYETIDTIATKESMIRNLTSTDSEVTWSTVGPQPTISFNPQFGHDSQASSDTQGYQVRNDSEDGNSTQYNTKTQYSIDNRYSIENQGLHETKVNHDTKGSHDTQNNDDTQVCHDSQWHNGIYSSYDTKDSLQSPISPVQSSVTAISQMAFSISSFTQHALGEMSFPADTLYLDSDSPNLLTPNHEPHLCQPLIVCEANCVNPVISETHDTQVCHNIPVCHNTQYKVGTQDIFDSYETIDTIATKESMNRNLTSTDSEVSWSTVGLQPAISLNPQFCHDSQASSDTQGSQVGNDSEDSNSTQYNTKTQYSIDNRYSIENQGIHDTKVNHDTQGSHDTQNNDDNQVCHDSKWHNGNHSSYDNKDSLQSPISLVQSSVTAISQMAYSSSSLSQHALGEMSFPADTLYQFSDSPDLPTPNHDPHLCQPLIVCEANCINPVISETHDIQDEYDTPVCHNTQYKVGTEEIFDSYESIDIIATKESRIRNLTSTDSEVSGSTVGLQPTISLNPQFSHDSTASRNTQGSQVGIDSEDGNSTQYNTKTQYSIDNRYSFENQGIHDTKVNHDTQGSHDTQNNNDTQVCHYSKWHNGIHSSYDTKDSLQSPISLVQSSVTAISQMTYSSSSLSQHALGEMSFPADTLYQFSDSPDLPTPNHDPHLCQPLIVCEANCINPVISETHDTQDEYDTQVNHICLNTNYSFDTQNSQTICSNASKDSFDTSMYLGIQTSIDTQDSEKTQDYGTNESFETPDYPNTQGSQDPRCIFPAKGLYDSPDTKACFETHTRTCRSLSSTPTEVSWQTTELKPYCVLSSACYDDPKYCQNTKKSNEIQECHEFQNRPSLLQKSESPISQQIISSSTNSKHNPVCFDTHDSQSSQDTQSKHDTKGSFDLQCGHDVQGTIGSKECLESQASHDFQDIQESPITNFQRPVSDVSHQTISSSFLHQQAIDMPSSLVDVSRVTPEQCSLLPQYHDNTHRVNDTQYSHETHVYYETQGGQNGLENLCRTKGSRDNVGHDTQDGHDTQECHESPVTLSQTSVSAVSQQLLTSQFLSKQALVVPSSCEDALSLFSQRAPVLPQPPFPNRIQNVCQPVGGAIGLDTDMCVCDTQDRNGTQCTLGTQGIDFQGCNESPGNIFKHSVSGDRRQMISSKPLPQHVTYGPLSLEDVPSQFPQHALGPTHLLTPKQDPDVCRPMSVREAICLIPAIQGPPLPHPQPITERNPKAKSSKAGVSRPLCRPSLMDNTELTLELEVSGGVPETTLTWLTEGQLMNSVDSNPSGLIKVQASDQRATLHAADALQDTHSNYSIEEWLVCEVYDIISLEWNTWFGTLCVIFCLLYLVLL